MDLNGVDKEAIGVISAGVAALVAFGYKALRILKSDKNSDGIDSEEKDLRLSLREEGKMLRDQNYQLCQEKLLLIERAVKAEATVEYLRQKCIDCGERNESSADN